LVGGFYPAVLDNQGMLKSTRQKKKNPEKLLPKRREEEGEIHRLWSPAESDSNVERKTGGRKKNKKRKNCGWGLLGESYQSRYENGTIRYTGSARVWGKDAQGKWGWFRFPKRDLSQVEKR